ncbi:glutamate receptor 2.7-like [Papaver somniferum]|uniref:glutamate receptor 2.7-like n=1 Tax=Papaver somniferum TaxID=3469 RepID=UPI000E6FA19C|nr:glutamate receptor 2.7-like [Papaver somniferum]
MLLANRFQPTFTDVSHLIKNRYNVGYKNGSFIEGMLKQMGFDESNLKVCHAPEGLDEAFSKQRQDGGILAAFDELPYIELLLAQYCDKYTKVGDIYPTGGFGFVFPKGSPLGLEISRTILSVREGKEKMKRIRNAWFGIKRSCSDHNSLGSSYGLTLYSFRYLFVFVGVISLIPLLAYLLSFLHKNKTILTSPNTSIIRKVIKLVGKFNGEDENRLRYYEYHAGIGNKERREVPPP